jgi:hypothetical protein
VGKSILERRAMVDLEVVRLYGAYGDGSDSDG